MEKKMLLITSVGLLIGLVVGVALGYLVAPSAENQQGQINELQSQINNLQNQITQKDSQIQTLQEQISELENLIGPIRKGDWNLIETFQGSSGLKTDYFYVAGTDLRINWTWVSSIEEYASFGIILYRKGQTVFTEMFFDLQDEGTTFAHNTKTDYYYFDISVANLDQWVVTVEAWIPEQ